MTIQAKQNLIEQFVNVLHLRHYYEERDDSEHALNQYYILFGMKAALEATEGEEITSAIYNEAFQTYITESME